MKLLGKTALITGASRGIGRAIALEFARQGVQRILLVARDPQRLAEVAIEVECAGSEAIPIALDLTQSQAVSIAVAQAWRCYGPIQLLVNCAGVAHQTPFLQSRLPDIQTEIDLNLLGTYTMTYLVARRMVSRQEGTIINVSSLMGKIAAPSMATYSATKFALLGFSQALRNELCSENIKVIALLPSLTETDMVRNLKLFRGIVPSKPEQVAKALVVGMKQDTSEILVSWQSYLAVWSQRLFPRLVEKMVNFTAPNPRRPFRQRPISRRV